MDRKGGQALLQQMFALAAAEPEVAFGRLQGRGADADGLDHGPGGAAGRERSLNPSRRGKGRIPRLGPDQRNEAARFVTLIDALYEAKVRLIASAADEPERLYIEGEGSFEFDRTASRLREMQAAGWGEGSSP